MFLVAKQRHCWVGARHAVPSKPAYNRYVSFGATARARHAVPLPGKVGEICGLTVFSGHFPKSNNTCYFLAFIIAATALPVLLFAFSAPASAKDDWPPPAAALKTLGDFTYVEQNGMVYDIPLFRGASSVFSLGGGWLKKRMAMNHELSLTARNAETIARLESEGGSAVGADEKGWEPKTIPSVENMPPADKYIGGVWYRRKFTPPAPFGGKRVRLVFLGANYIADVWVNGKWVGWHEGGFTSFAFDITPFVKPGAENTIAVRLDNPPWIEEHMPWKRAGDAALYLRMTPYKPCDWWNYSGIYRDVFLVADNDERIENLALTAAPSDKGGAIDVHFLARFAKGKQYRARVEVFDTDINENNILNFDPRSIAANKIFTAEQPLPDPAGSAPLDDGRELAAFRVKQAVPGVSAWTPESPTLYVLKFSILDASGNLIEEDVRQFGFREVSVSADPPRFSLNGKPRILRGTNRHEDLPEAGRLQTMADLAGLYRDLKFIKLMNCDYLRTAHYPNHPAVFMLADRMGLLAAEEIPVYWFDEDGFAMQRKRGIAGQMWFEMIARDRNFTSAVFWSMGNETTGGSEEVAFFKKLFADGKTLDPTRLIYHVTRGDTLWDPSIGIGDIISLNIYHGVFDRLEIPGAVRKSLKTIHKRFPRKPIMITEFGTGAGMDDPKSIVNQQRVFFETIDTALELPYVTGFAWWSMISYTSRDGVGHGWGIYPFDRGAPLPIAEVIGKKYGEMREKK